MKVSAVYRRPADRGRRMLARAMALLITVHGAGCAQIGPRAMRSSRLAYNEAMQVSEQRELLLNLVRLRYTEPPEFLAVNGISTQMIVEASMGLEASAGREGGDSVSLFDPTAGVNWSERPTVTFSPQRSSAFTRQLVAPIEIDSLYLLAREGWGIDRVLRLLAWRLNGVSFAAADGITLRRLEAAGLLWIALEQRRVPVAPPLPAAALSPVDLIRFSADGFEIDYRPADSTYAAYRLDRHYVLCLAPAACDDPAFAAAAGRLRLPAGAQRIEIDPGEAQEAGDGARLDVAMRSALGVLRYLAQAVEAPAADIERGVLVPDPDPSGGNGLTDLLKVQAVDGASSASAHLAVYHRGHRFLVAAADLASRETLALASAILRLSIDAGGAQNIPVLTLPVGG